MRNNIIPTYDGFDRNCRAGNIHKLAASYALEPEINRYNIYTMLYFMFRAAKSYLPRRGLTLRVLWQVLLELP